MSHWSAICDVSPEALGPLAAWVRTADSSWSVVGPTKPSRIMIPPEHEVGLIVAQVLPAFLGMVRADSPMLSRMLPGQSHPYHTDVQRADCITRVHVPITTNPGCWMMFEEEGEQVHFEVGRAYSFNTLARHAFGNDGDEPRVHLIFEVLRT